MLSEVATEEKTASGSEYSYGDSKPQESSIETVNGKIEKKPPLNSNWCGGSGKVAGISEKPLGSKAYSKPQEVRIRNGVGTFVQKLWSLASRCQADATTAMVHLVVTFSVAVIMSCCCSYLYIAYNILLKHMVCHTQHIQFTWRAFFFPSWCSCVLPF